MVLLTYTLIHITRNITAHLNNTVPQNWIGRRGKTVPVKRLPKSLSNFLYSAFKNKVVAFIVESKEESIRGMQKEANEIRMMQKCKGGFKLISYRTCVVISVFRESFVF